MSFEPGDISEVPVPVNMAVPKLNAVFIGFSCFASFIIYTLVSQNINKDIQEFCKKGRKLVLTN